MPIQKEIWQRSIVEGFFADNTFASKAENDDIYVNEGKKVHIPNAGAASKVVKNRASLPASAKTRTDVDVEYTLDEFTTDPIRIPHADTVELSYDKRNSVISQDRAQLFETAYQELLYNWAPGKKNCVPTTGVAEAAHTEDATGNRKAVDKKDILALMTMMDKDNVPQEDRYLLLDAVMYAQLLASLTETEAIGFYAAADVKNGVIGSIYGFNVMKRSQVLRYNGDNLKKFGEAGAAADNAAALAWQKSCLSRALGEVKVFDSTDDPLYYGDIYSFLVRAGGAVRRSDKKGVYALVQAAAV
ncbi:MAG: hypothetical protein ACTTGW_01285 [Candidatus Cryptobacteroides sp.]